MTSRLRDARLRLGLKQSQVVNELTKRASAAGISIAAPASLKTMLSNFENGSRNVHEPYRGLFRAIYGMTDAELFDTPSNNAGNEPASEYAMFVERIASARAITAETARVFAQQTDYLRTADCHLGAAPLVDQMSAHLATVEHALSHAIVPSVRRPLAAVLADAAALAAWQALDVGAINRAWSYHEKARAAALEAQDPVLLTHAMAQQAMVLLEVEDVASARELAEVAVGEAGSKVPNRFRAWLLAAEAEVHSTAGDSDACRHRFDKAAQLLPPGTDAVEPDMPFIVLNQDHLARWEGNALARLGDEDAIDHLYQALNGDGSVSTRAMAGLRCDLAYAHLLRGERHEASEHANQARLLARRAGSLRQQRRVRRLLKIA